MAHDVEHDGPSEKQPPLSWRRILLWAAVSGPLAMVVLIGLTLLAETVDFQGVRSGHAGTALHLMAFFAYAPFTVIIAGIGGFVSGKARRLVHAGLATVCSLPFGALAAVLLVVVAGALG